MSMNDYDPSSALSRPPEIGELIWVRNKSNAWVQGRIDRIIPIAQMLAHCDERGRSFDHEVWLHPGFIVFVWVEDNQCWLETRFREDHRKAPSDG